MPESIEASRFVSHRARMSRKFDSRKYSQSTKFERGPRIFVKLSFRELCDSKLCGLHALLTEKQIILFKTTVNCLFNDV